MDLGLKARTAVVLGGTSGIGAAIARGLGDEGANVVIVGRSADKAAELAASLPSAVPTSRSTSPTLPPPTGSSRPPPRRSGRSTCWCSTEAGHGPARLTDFDGDALDAAVDLLVRPHLAPGREGPARHDGARLGQDRGRRVLRGTAAAAEPRRVQCRPRRPGWLPQDARGRGRRPGRHRQHGAARTHRHRARRPAGRGHREADGDIVGQARAASEATIPSGRYGTPEEFAAVAVFLASEAAGYVTGEQVRCDGGLVRHH